MSTGFLLTFMLHASGWKSPPFPSSASVWNIALCVNCEYTNKWLFEGSITLFCCEFEYWRIYAFFVLIFWVKKCACAIFHAFCKSAEKERDPHQIADLQLTPVHQQRNEEDAMSSSLPSPPPTLPLIATALWSGQVWQHVGSLWTDFQQWRRIKSPCSSWWPSHLHSWKIFNTLSMGWVHISWKKW